MYFGPNSGENITLLNILPILIDSKIDVSDIEVDDGFIGLNLDLVRVVLNTVKDLNEFQYALEQDLLKPGYDFDFTNYKVAKFSSDLLMNLDLTLTKYGTLFGKGKKVVVDDSITYNIDEKQRFRNMILKENYYFSSSSNIRYIPRDILDEYTQAICLRNSRVTLSWRNVDILMIDQLKIVTFSIALLVGSINEAEFLILIKDAVPYYQYKIRVSNHLRKFVHVHIENDLFTFR